MEDLLVGSVRGAADDTVVLRPGQVFDVAQNHVRFLAVELVVLPPALGSDVRGDARVDDDVLFAGVLVHSQTADHEESVAVVQLRRQTAQFPVQVRKRECLLSEMAQRQTQALTLSRISETYKSRASGHSPLKWSTARSISSSCSALRT